MNDLKLTLIINFQAVGDTDLNDGRWVETDNISPQVARTAFMIIPPPPPPAKKNPKPTPTKY